MSTPGLLLYADQVQLLRAAGELLRLPQPVIATALTFLHRYHRACPPEEHSRQARISTWNRWMACSAVGLAHPYALAIVGVACADRPGLPIPRVQSRRGKAMHTRFTEVSESAFQHHTH